MLIKSWFNICAAGVPNLAMVESVDDEKVIIFFVFFFYGFLSFSAEAYTI